MLRLLLNRSVLQLVVSGCQLVQLGLFVILWPRLAETPRSWAADYFLSIAVLTPIFIFFSFELRKLTAAGENAQDLPTFHRTRVTGLACAIVTSLAALGVMLAFGLHNSTQIFLAVLVFKISQTIGDQISAHYEFSDNFKGSARSMALKSLGFVVIGFLAGFVIGPTAGVVLASLSVIAIAWLYDRPLGALSLDWFKFDLKNLSPSILITGLGSFLVSMTIYWPRILATVLLGEAALVLMGVGQSLNRVGQVISNGVTQALIVLQKRKGFETARSIKVVFGLQVGIALAVALAIPVWKWAFDYIADDPNFVYVILLLLMFGLASQFNYLVQSLNLIQRGRRGFVIGPIIFLVIFSIGLLIVHLTLGATIFSLLILALIARLVQVIYNLNETAKGKATT